MTKRHPEDAVIADIDRLEDEIDLLVHESLTKFCVDEQRVDIDDLDDLPVYEKP